MKGYGGKNLLKRKVLALEWKSERVMDDESGESMELMKEVPLIGLGKSQNICPQMLSWNEYLYL